MLTLMLYPSLFGLPDNNPFGLKVDTFFRLTNITYKTKHVLDTKGSPCGQLPYIDDNGNIIGDSNNIIAYIGEKYNVNLDNNLTDEQKNLHFLISSMLENHLYWVIAYSRWQDEQNWPLFKAEFLKQGLNLQISDMEKIREYCIAKYNYQGIGKYDCKDVYQSGIADLKAISSLLGNNDFIFNNKIHSIDAHCYGFLANIYYADIDTPLKQHILNNPPLEKYITRIRKLLDY